MIRTLSHRPETPDAVAPLAEWLTWLETIHPVAIDMGLERVGRVADRLALRPVQRPLVLVGGTNGKGSTVAMLAAVYKAAGFRVGAYTSPHISDFRERIRVDGEMAEAQLIVDALAFVEMGRAPDTLTYFEYTTLAAMHVFQQADCDVYLLEVGLGGRLDATNLWDADCSVVTSIALDHQDYLGSDVRVIATEKAAIGRAEKTLVVGDTDPPDSLFDFAASHGISIDHVGRLPESLLPVTNLQGAHQRRNAACASAVVKTLQKALPVPDETLQSALLRIGMSARFEQLMHGSVTVVFDVAHNPAGAQALLQTWQAVYGARRAELVFASLVDKDVTGIAKALDPLVAHWHCLPLEGYRAMPLDQLCEAVQGVSDRPVARHASAAEAWQQAHKNALDGDRLILVAGSFYTVASLRGLVAPGAGHSQ